MQNMYIDSLKNWDSYINLVEDIKNLKTPIAVHGIIDENIGHISYALKEHTNKQVLIITHDQMKAKKIYEDIKSFDEDVVELFPHKEILLYKVDAISSERTIDRLNILSRIVKGEPIIVVAYVESTLNKLMNPNLFQKMSIEIDGDDSIDLAIFTERLALAGYKREAMVEAEGQFSVRGGIIDFFPPNSENPYRIELFDDEIDSIRTFDIATQRSLEIFQSVSIPPAREIFILDDFRQEVLDNIVKDLNRATKGLEKNSPIKENMVEKFEEYISQIEEKLSISNMDMVVPYIPEDYLSNILDYFNKNSLVFLDDTTRIEEKTKEIQEQFLLKYSDMLESGEVLPRHANINYEYSDVTDRLNNKICLLGSSIAKIDYKFEAVSSIKLTTKGIQYFHNNMELLNKELNYYKYRGYKIIIFSGTKEKGKMLVSNLMDLGLVTSYVDDENRDIKSSQIFIRSGSINRGFEYPDIKMAFISEEEIFGTSKQIRKTKKKSKEASFSYSDLKIGDYVVHENHGVGQYGGVEQLDIQGIIKDYLLIRYRNNDKLYVPVDQMDLVQKYVGGDGEKPKVNKLSSPEWSRVKNRAKKAVEDMAKDLLDLYAKRETVKGYSFSEDTIWQKEFEDAFPYEETDAQLRCTDEIKKDMETDKPMDRLLCGDVGFGKTEVALRAAFKAIMDGKQVAFLVPTTILAQQHYNTILERFEGFPINVEMLSRFRTQGQQKKAIEGMKKGLVDIVVGTHRLLSKDIVFKDLGLLIVDEEQRFGVKHKETLKKLKENVDVLTLTATPIPRTLHMSLTGVRDMSIIDEPPQMRYPIETYVVEFNERMIREAILKELARDGQVYFVYNRVESIDMIASHLMKLVPEANIVVAHGQMSEKRLETIMMDFIDYKYNVLVCTTIIETGIDIPNVNTIIVYNADKMGLSQLYQLRGRVGRTNKIAYAYLTYEKDKVLTEIAEKRLRAIKDFTEFGSGFKIAMRDLEIRGAGNLLGTRQHGHIEAIGYDLYVKYLNQAIKRLKGEKVEEKVDTTIELNVDGYIPSKYIEDEEQKIEIYKKIASVQSEEDYRDLVDELLDRFGDVPKQVENLLDISYIRNNASRLYIESISQSNNIITMQFVSVEHISIDLINYLSKEYGRRVEFNLSKNPFFKYRVRKDILAELKEIINKINNEPSYKQ